MNAKQIRDFFKNKKNVQCPLTEELIKSGYQQRSGGYIKYAHEYSKLHPEDVIEVDYTKAMPNQWWHLIRSWCDRSEPSDKFTRSIRCGELYFWMAEVSGKFTNEELIKIKDSALDIAKRTTYDNKLPLRTACSNEYIRDMCFERIKEVIENNGNQ